MRNDWLVMAGDGWECLRCGEREPLDVGIRATTFLELLRRVIAEHDDCVLPPDDGDGSN